MSRGWHDPAAKCPRWDDPLGRERHMVTLFRDDAGLPTVWCDPCIAGLVDRLNREGHPTVASCCGHGRMPGIVSLADGRDLTVDDAWALLEFDQ